jgi:hypothetical protein
MTFTAYTFTDAQLVDIRRFCGYPVYGSGAVVFPAPWTMKQYMALEYKLQNINTDEANVVINTYLANLNTLETAIPATGANLDTDAAAVWIHNKNEQRDRERLFDGWRMRLCQFLGVPPGPNLGAVTGALVV